MQREHLAQWEDPTIWNIVFVSLWWAPHSVWITSHGTCSGTELGGDRAAGEGGRLGLLSPRGEAIRPAASSSSQLVAVARGGGRAI